MLVLPDILVVALVFLVIATDLFFNPSQTWQPCFRVAWVGLLAIFAVQCLLPAEGTTDYWSNYRVAGWSFLLKQVFVLAALFTVWMSASYLRAGGNWRGRLLRAGDFFAMLVACVAGMCVVVSARELVTLFVGLELATIPLYVLTASYRGEDESGEAAIKYILMGSLSTAIILFGYSMIYGTTGSVRFDAIAAFAAGHPDDLLLRAGALLIFAAVGFKLAMAPFHMWAPDVYEGAPAPVTAFISVGSKSAALGFVLLVFYGPLAALRPALAPVFVAMAALSMLVGNLGSLRQRNFRRFMAYSSIAQVGYILMALLADRSFATGSLIYYLVVYLAGNMGAFFVFSVIGQKRGEELRSLNGLSRQNPALAAVLLLSMFSLAGVPPLAGFTGKFLLFASAAATGHYGLLLFAALNSVASLYYYMCVIKEAYITEPEHEPAALEVPATTRWALLLIAAMLLVLGVWPGLNTLVFRAGAGM